MSLNLTDKTNKTDAKDALKQNTREIANIPFNQKSLIRLSNLGSVLIAIHRSIWLKVKKELFAKTVIMGCVTFVAMSGEILILAKNMFVEWREKSKNLKNNFQTRDVVIVLNAV